MSKKYKEIIAELEKAVEGIQSQGISIEPLNSAIKELKSHSENISVIEENIDAVKSEVITPIKEELDQNRRAGKFSIWGFYIGAFGLIVTAVSLLYTTFNVKPSSQKLIHSHDTLKVINKHPIPEDYLIKIDNSLKELNYSISGLNENYETKANEIYLNREKNRGLLMENESVKLSVEAYVPPESKIEKKYYPFVSLTFFINGKQIGTKGLKDTVTIINNSGVSHYYDVWSSVWLTEGDSFMINETKFTIVRIFRDESQILSVADNEDGVLIKKTE